MKTVDCKYCKNGFIPVRAGHLYCSDTCRKLAHKSNKQSKNKRANRRKLGLKLAKLAASKYGRYLIAELRRAGTVQVLHGHTHLTLQELADLRRQCATNSGYENGAAIWTYELSHIKPVKSEEEIGLLHPVNLVLASKEFNRRLSNKSPSVLGRGTAINRAELIEKWNIEKSITSLEVLKLARKYVGPEFDLWLKKYSISINQKSKLFVKLKRAGITEKTLLNKSFQELKAIEQLIDEKDTDIDCWTFSKQPLESYLSVLNELNRFEIDGEIKEALLQVKLEDESVFYPSGWHWNFKGTNYSEYVSFLVEQAELLLHGQPFRKEWNSVKLMDWWEHNPPKPKEVNDEDDDRVL